MPVLKYLLIAFTILQVVTGYKKDGKCYKSMNLVIALDSSGSIEPESWQSEIDLSKQIIQSMSISDSGNQFAMLDFSTKPNVILNLDPNPEKVLSALNGLKSDFKDGHSFIDSALEEAANLLQSSKSSNHLNTLLIITDGYMTLRNGKEDAYYLSPAKDKLAAAKIEVFAVGVGKYINQDALKLMASNPSSSHVFEVKDGKTLLEQFQKSAEVPCPDINGSDTGRAGTSEPIKCGRVMFERIGCYKDKQLKPRPLPDLVFTDRDTTSRVYSGQTINWKQWDTYMPKLVCRCAEESVKKMKIVFGIQFYGECWANAKTDSYNKDGTAKSTSNCKTLGYKPCDEAAKYCVGESEHNFVYKITEVLEK